MANFILEAFAQGKPVIASNLGGMKELIGANERGLLVEPGNPQGLAEAMDILYSHPDLAYQSGQKAFDYAVKNHSASEHLRRINRVYDMSLNK